MFYVVYRWKSFDMIRIWMNMNEYANIRVYNTYYGKVYISSTQLNWAATYYDLIECAMRTAHIQALIPVHGKYVFSNNRASISSISMNNLFVFSIFTVTINSRPVLDVIIFKITVIFEVILIFLILTIKIIKKRTTVEILLQQYEDNILV